MPEFYRKATKAYEQKDLTLLLENSRQVLDLLLDLDELLGSHEYFLLGKWLKEANSIPESNESDKRLYEYNARNQVTLWGPKGEIIDYATKQWNGLVRDYYYPRWKMFFDYLSLTLIDPFHFPIYNQTRFEEAFMAQVGIPFTESQKSYAEKPLGNPVKLALQTYHVWRPKADLLHQITEIEDLLEPKIEIV